MTQRNPLPVTPSREPVQITHNLPAGPTRGTDPPADDPNNPQPPVRSAPIEGSQGRPVAAPGFPVTGGKTTTQPARTSEPPVSVWRGSH
jgi:hypothetical protein